MDLAVFLALPPASLNIDFHHRGSLQVLCVKLAKLSDYSTIMEVTAFTYLGIPNELK